jgi:hypothetical protein
MPYISVEECRTVLGEAAADRSDEQIEHLRDSLEGLAFLMYDEIAQQAFMDPEGVRWDAYAFEHPDEASSSETPDDAFPSDGPNLLEIPDEEV